MNTRHAAALLRELADELEREDARANATAPPKRRKLAKPDLAYRRRCLALRVEAESWKRERNKWRKRCEREAQEWTRLIELERARSKAAEMRIEELTRERDDARQTAADCAREADLARHIRARGSR